MAQQNKTKLKTYYQTGDTPTSGQYGELIDSSLNLAETALQTGEFSVSSSGNLRMMGSSSFVGPITASGNISSSGRLYGNTLNTGQGNYELFAMDQNVTTSDTVTFAGINFTKAALSSVTYGSLITANGQSFRVQIDTIPAIPSLEYEGEVVTLRNTSIALGSVVNVTSVGETLVFHAFNVGSGECQLKLQNLGQLTYSGGSVTFNFTVL